MLVPSWPHLSVDARETITLLEQPLRRLALMLNPKEIDASRRMPQEALEHAAQMGLFGLSIPQAYGGGGLTPPGFVRVMERLATIDLSVAVTLGAHQALAAQSLVAFGSEAQRQRYLPAIASGETVAAFAMTEANSGSGVSYLTTQAREQTDGAWLLKGSKAFITNGPLAKVFITFARCRSAAGEDDQTPTAFIVEAGDRVSAGPPLNKLGVRASQTSDVYFDETPVPAGNVLGGRGNGFTVSQGSLAFSRLAVAAGWTGAAKQVIDLATAHAQGRRIGPQVVADYAMIKELLGDMVVDTFAAESMVRLTAAIIASGFPDFGVESAVCKMFCTESACRVADRGIQIGGGSGYLRDLPFERLLRDLRVGPIFEGTNEVIRIYVASRALQGPRRRLTRLAQALGEGTDASWQPEPGLAEQHAEWLALVDETDAAVAALRRRYPTQVLEQQHHVRRMVTAWIELFAMAACLSRARTPVEVAATAARWHHSARRIRYNLSQLTRTDDAKVEGVGELACTQGGYPFEEPPEEGH